MELNSFLGIYKTPIKDKITKFYENKYAWNV